MGPTLIVGVIIFLGFLLGELVSKVNLPRITGYIIAGILLNPQLFHIIPKEFTQHTELITNIALSFITFSVGGTLLVSKIREQGKSIFSITIFESEFAFIIVALGLFLTLPLFVPLNNGTIFTAYLPIALLIGSLASPTDPSSTLAIIHEYKAKGPVSSTIMGVAAFDDALGIINYSIAIVVSHALITHTDFSIVNSIVDPIINIVLSVGLGAFFGLILNLITKFGKRETDGVLIVEVLGLLLICFGVSNLLHLDELLGTMSMGAIVVNFNSNREKIFKLLERYIEEIILVIFFVLAGMHLNFSTISSSLILIVLFVILRAFGKFIGVYLGAHISKSPAKVKKYTFGGLIPQGGIVVGMALMIKQNPAFSTISDIIIGVIIGTTIIHELIGPVISKLMLNKSDELFKAED